MQKTLEEDVMTPVGGNQNSLKVMIWSEDGNDQGPYRASKLNNDT